MQSLRKTLGTLLGLALIGGLAAGAYFGIKRIVALWLRLDFQVAMVTAIAAVALLLAAAIVAASIRHAGARVSQVDLRADKAEAYLTFIGVWEELLSSGQGAEGMARLSRQMQSANHLLLLHASAAVVKAHTAMQDLNLPEARAEFANALIEIRKDLGLESRDLAAEDLALLLLTERDNARGPVRSGAHQDRRPRVSLAPKS
jgi:hypothetical protein